VSHLFDGGAQEQIGEGTVALVLAVEVEVHVLMYSGHFIRDSFI
jgi:hypothetical protein